MKAMVIPIVIGALSAVPKSLVTRLEELEIKERSETIVKIDQNTEKNPGELIILAVTQPPVREQQLKKTTTGNNNNMCIFLQICMDGCVCMHFIFSLF